MLWKPFFANPGIPAKGRKKRYRRPAKPPFAGSLPAGASQGRQIRPSPLEIHPSDTGAIPSRRCLSFTITAFSLAFTSIGNLAK
jgi:hypothetical protein